MPRKGQTIDPSHSSRNHSAVAGLADGPGSARAGWRRRPGVGGRSLAIQIGASLAAGRRVAVHPMAKAAVTGPVATDAPFEIDGNFFTAQEEHAIPAMIGRVVEALK